MTEPRTPTRLQIVRLDKDGAPAGDPVDVDGVVSVQFAADPPPHSGPSLRPLLTDEQRAAVDRTVAAVVPVVAQLRAQMEAFVRTAAPALAAAARQFRAYVDVLESDPADTPRQNRQGPRQKRRGVDAQRSPYGPNSGRRRLG
ncbi:hypothetical protein [Streptomyces sp. NPDC049879]|uniref:hypothetical protein n=1 Tax=Streptomyces sp. NPDC049879 TaxID=3365598 RepID=UPI0037A0AD2A